MTSSEKKKSALGFGPTGSNKMDFSGKERDKLFLSDGGKRFVDVSYLGGVDNPQDGRTVATADLDHDGSLEMLVAHRNAPLLRVYSRTAAARGHVLGLILSGSGKASNTDAIGAKAVARCDGASVTGLVQVGAGFATQNSRTLTLGVGACEKVGELAVTWPNGRERVFKDVKTDELYSLAEDGPLHHEPGFYSARAPAPVAAVSAGKPAATLLSALDGGRAHLAGGGAKAWRPARDVVFVSFWASWCESCKRAQPRLDALAAKYQDRVEFVGVTLDAKDDAAVVGAYATEHKPGYPLLSLAPEARASFTEQVKPLFRGAAPPLPSSLLVDKATGAVLLRTIGAPTVSDLESALSRN